MAGIEIERIKISYCIKLHKTSVWNEAWIPEEMNSIELISLTLSITRNRGEIITIGITFSQISIIQLKKFPFKKRSKKKIEFARKAKNNNRI